MEFSRYKKIILVYCIVLLPFMIVVLVNGVILSKGGDGFLLINPIDNAGADSLIIIGLTLLAAIIGAIIGGYLLGPLFLVAQKNTIGRKMIYGIQDKPKSEKLKGIFIKTLFPALLAMNLSLIFAQSEFIQQITIKQKQIGAPMVMPMIISALIPIMCGIAMGIFSPVWFLLDSGIVYTNKKKVENTSNPTEIKSVGGWYMYLLKGYAGISVIINFYIFVTQLLQSVRYFDASIVMLFVFWPIMPIFLAFLLMPSMIALDKTFEKRREFMRKWAKKLKITEIFEEPK